MQWVFSGRSSFLFPPKDMQITVTGYSKLPVGINVSMNDVTVLAQGVPHLLPEVIWD